MKKRVTTLIIIAAVFLTAAVVYAGYAAHMLLDEPVFLTHYYDIPRFGSGRMIDLDYITNKNDNRSVTDVMFPESPDLPVSLNIDSDYNTFFYHKTRHVYVRSELPYDEEFPLTMLTTMRVTFSDGTENDFDIGKIIVGNKPDGSEYIRSMSSGASNMGEASEEFLVLKDCRLMDITNDFTEDIGTRIDIKINGADYTLPMELHQGDTVAFNSALDINDENVYNAYAIDSTLTFEDSEGNIFYGSLLNLSYAPTFAQSFTSYGLNEYLKRRGLI